MHNFYYCVVSESWGIFFMITKRVGDFGMLRLCCGAVAFCANWSRVLGLAVGTEMYTAESRILLGQ